MASSRGRKLQKRWLSWCCILWLHSRRKLSGQWENSSRRTWRFSNQQHRGLERSLSVIQKGWWQYRGENKRSNRRGGRIRLCWIESARRRKCEHWRVNQQEKKEKKSVEPNWKNNLCSKFQPRNPQFRLQFRLCDHPSRLRQIHQNIRRGRWANGIGCENRERPSGFRNFNE